jgi:hypothetical protein
MDYSRKKDVSVNEVAFKFSPLKPSSGKEEEAAALAVGSIIVGLSLEGASWNADMGVLDEAKPRVGIQVFCKGP